MCVRIMSGHVTDMPQCVSNVPYLYISALPCADSVEITGAQGVKNTNYIILFRNNIIVSWNVCKMLSQLISNVIDK